MKALQVLMFSLLPAGVVLALAGGYFLARRALAPIEHIVRMADSITVANLHQRIKVVNSEDELGHLAITLNSLIARLERAVDEIRRFTADASHEIRTPLAAIRAEAESALRLRRQPEEYETALANVVDEASRLGRLADQLLSLSRHDAGISDLRHEPVRVDSLILDVAEQLRPLAVANGLTLEVSAAEPCEVTGDDIRLSQALFNVLENAIKYTLHAGSVRVSCGYEGSQVKIEVEDSGIGISAEHLECVFDRFYRIDSSRSATGGSGLGLAIARAAILAHHGSISISSEVGRGTTLSICIPSAHVASDASTHVSQAVPQSKRQGEHAGQSAARAPSSEFEGGRKQYLINSVLHRLLRVQVHPHDPDKR